MMVWNAKRQACTVVNNVVEEKQFEFKCCFFCLILFGLISTEAEGEQLMWWQFCELNCIPLLSVYMHLAQSYRSNLYSSFLNKGVMLHKVLLCYWLMCPKCLEYVTGATCTVTHCTFVSDCSEMLRFILPVKRALVFNLLTPKHRPLCTVMPQVHIWVLKLLHPGQ